MPVHGESIPRPPSHTPVTPSQLGRTSKESPWIPNRAGRARQGKHGSHVAGMCNAFPGRNEGRPQWRHAIDPIGGVGMACNATSNCAASESPNAQEEHDVRKKNKRKKENKSNVKLGNNRKARSNEARLKTHLPMIPRRRPRHHIQLRLLVPLIRHHPRQSWPCPRPSRRNLQFPNSPGLVPTRPSTTRTRSPLPNCRRRARTRRRHALGTAAHPLWRGIRCRTWFRWRVPRTGRFLRGAQDCGDVHGRAGGAELFGCEMQVGDWEGCAWRGGGGERGSRRCADKRGACGRRVARVGDGSGWVGARGVRSVRYARCGYRRR